MAGYTKSESRDWAREKLVGAVNCTIPPFTNDLKRINEKAIRHDIRLAKEHGFVGSLGVSEIAITVPEYADFLRIAKDEAGDDFYIVHHASWSNLEENLEALKGAEQAGADLVLLTYPPNFYPETEQEVFDYTKAVCDATNLGVILFPMTIWNFSARIHPSDIPTRLVRRLIDEVPNVAVIKAEGGYPNVQYAIECHRLFGREVVISVPIEADLIPLSQVIPIQLSATSDHEYYGPVIPQVMQLLRDGKHDEATEIFWRLHPARKVKAGLFARAARRVGPQPAGVEVPGLAAGLQRRPVADADDATPGRSDGRAPQGAARLRIPAEHGSVPRLLRGAEPGLIPTGVTKLTAGLTLVRQEAIRYDPFRT